MNHNPKSGPEPVTFSQYLGIVAAVVLVIGIIAVARLCENCVGDITILRIEHSNR